MSHHTSPNFWKCYQALPARVQELADQSFRILKRNPRHPSLHFKKVGRFRSVRVGSNYRALGVESSSGIVWFWIGTHEEYNKLIQT